MDAKDQKEIESIEKQIQALFAKCEAPAKGSNRRISGILLRGLHELSLRDLIQFISKLVSTMFAIVTGPKKSTNTNGEKT